MNLHIVPYGFECEISECPAGPFLFRSGDKWCVGFKAEYAEHVYNEAGEFYCNKTGKVQPAIYEWREE